MRNCLKLFGSGSDVKELLHCLNSSEKYLKARFSTHCKCNDSCSSHCINHALSHPTDNDLYSTCEKSHDVTCGECLALRDCFTKFRSMISQLPAGHEKEVAEYDIINSESVIMDWQKHIMRGVQQSKARSDAFSNLDQTSAIWLRDYAQKVLPSKVASSSNICLPRFHFNIKFIF